MIFFLSLSLLLDNNKKIIHNYIEFKIFLEKIILFVFSLVNAIICLNSIGKPNVSNLRNYT